MVLFPGMTDAPLSDEPYYGIRRGSRCCSGERDGLPANVPVRGRGVRHGAGTGAPPRHQTGKGASINDIRKMFGFFDPLPLVRIWN